MHSDSESFISDYQVHRISIYNEFSSRSDPPSGEESPRVMLLESGKFGQQVFQMINSIGIKIDFSNLFPSEIFYKIFREKVVSLDYLEEYYDNLEFDIEGRGYYTLTLKAYEEFSEETEGAPNIEYFQRVLPLLVKVLKKYPETQNILSSFHIKVPIEYFMHKHAALLSKIGGLGQRLSLIHI